MDMSLKNIQYEERKNGSRSTYSDEHNYDDSVSKCKTW